MANVNKNPMVRSASGKFGKHFVFKTRGKNTSLAQMPTVKPNAVKSEKQVKVTSRFRSASKYATGAITSEALKKEYQKKVSAENTAFNVAFRDFLKAPQVQAIETEDYNGSIGSTITVRAEDDFKVAAVKVSIHTAEGVLVEEGNALIDPIFSTLWVYTATQANADVPGTVITATATDVPRNKASLSVTLK